MQGFLLKTLVLLFLGLAVGLIASRNTGIQLHLAPVSPRNPAADKPVKEPAGPDQGLNQETEPAVPDAAAGNGASAAAPDQKNPPPEVTPPVASSGAAALFISLTDAKKKFDDGSVIFIDAREFGEFKKGHIRGSMHLDKRYFDGAAPAKARNFLPGMEVVVYCHGAACSDSEALIKRLQALNLGIGPYHILNDGFPGWQSAGYPVDVGEEVGFQ